MIELILTLLSTLVTAVIIPFITVSGQRLISYINTKIRNENEKQMTTQAVVIVTDAVKAVMQSYVDEQKKNGSFDKEAHSQAFNKAKAIIISQTTVKLTEFINQTFGDYDSWLCTQIEAAVNTVKQCNNYLEPEELLSE